MSILNEISSMFSVYNQRPPATEEEIKTLQNFSPVELPTDYLDILKEASELWIEVKYQYHNYLLTFFCQQILYKNLI
ncbi:hypothetical protein HMPREF9374_0409 [Desmospora sp. 8437]|nr:hypothetical protein HMPREF9374_0409 [Desmospora sp. 8437]